METGMDDLKSAKEAFVSGHSGTSHWDVLMLIMAQVLLSQPGSWVSKRVGFGAGLCCEFAIIFLPTIAAYTELLAPRATFIASLCVFLGFSALCISECSEAQSLVTLQDFAKPRRRYLDVFRGHMMTATCLAILAVDFHVFPRKFAKAETYGTGLMDIGSGMFVYASGLVSNTTTLEHKGRSAYRTTVLSSLRRACPLLVLGSLRLLFVSAASYQVHVGEYGVHWNFFITLAGVTLLTSLIPVDGVNLIIGAVVTLAIHQLSLSFGGLSTYINSEERSHSLVDLNKEGIFSLAGYWSMHLWGAVSGQALLGSAQKFLDMTAKGKKSDSKDSVNGFRALSLWIGSLAMGTVTVYGLLLVCIEYIEPVSRRSCNLSYIIWVAGVSLTIVLVCSIAEMLGNSSSLLTIVSNEMLVVFLFANLATGAVNMLVNTMEVGNNAARGILGVYMALVCAAGVLSNQRKPSRNRF